MTLTRRIYLYLVGISIGGLVAYGIYGDRLINGAWTPGAKVKQRLRSTLVSARPSAQAQLDARSLTLSDLRLALAEAEVDLSATKRTEDTLYYAVEVVAGGQPYTLTIVGLRDFDRDSTATLWDLQPTE